MARLHFLDPNPPGAPAVLLLHGLGADGASWTLNLPALLEAGFRPIAPDAPGFGGSPYDGLGWTPARVAADLAALLDELGTGPAHVVGLSMGGVIAQQFARAYPHLVRKLVLVSTFSALRPDDLSGWLYFLRRMVAVNLFGLRTQARVVAGRIFPYAEQAPLREILVETICRADPRAYRAAMRALGLFDSRPWLAEIKAPTLVVAGSADTTVSLARQELLAKGIPAARQVIVQGGGHALPVDHAEEFNRILVGFLREP